MAAIAIPTYLSYVNRAKDSEASTNLGAIFTDETAFSATNSVFINAGQRSAPATTVAPVANTVSPVHAFYDAVATIGAGTYFVDTPPFTCAAGVLDTQGGFTTEPLGTVTNATGTATMAVGGFGDIGFYPKGSLYFFYDVQSDTAANAAVPVSTTTWANQTNGVCGAGYTALAESNFAGVAVPQVYAVNDFSSTPTLIKGTPF